MKKLIIIPAIGVLALAYFTLPYIFIPKDAITIMINDTFTVDETVKFSIKNNTNSDFTIENHCPEQPLDVYFLDKSSQKWQKVHALRDDKCRFLSKFINLPANKTVSTNYKAWKGKIFTKPGKYRLKTEIYITPLIGRYFSKDIKITK